jgi:hypothetical protein
MNLAAALAETSADKAGRTHLALFLENIEGDVLDQVLAALNNKGIQQTHLARALTKLAHEAGILPPKSGISPMNVKDWRIAAGVRS